MLKVSKRKEKPSSGVIYFLAAPKYLKRSFRRYLRRIFKVLSKRFGIKWLSTGWDYVDSKIFKPYLNFEHSFVNFISTPFIYLNVKDLVWVELYNKKKERILDFLELVLKVWPYIKKLVRKIFVKLNLIPYVGKDIDMWYVEFMQRERRAFGYPRKDWFSPFKLFMTITYVWSFISELDAEMIARQEMYLYEWFYRFDFFWYLRRLKIRALTPRFLSLHLISQYYFIALLELNEVRSFLDSLVLRKKRNIVAEVVLKNYLRGFFSSFFQHFFLKIRSCYLSFLSIVLILLLDFFKMSPVHVRLLINLFARFDYGLKELKRYNSSKAKLKPYFFKKLSWLNDLLYYENSILSEFDLCEVFEFIALRLLSLVENFYKSDFFAFFRYYKYYKIITLGKNYLYGFFYKFFVIYFFITNIYLFFFIHPVSEKVLTSHYVRHMHYLLRKLFLEIPYSMSILDLSSEWMALFLFCFTWVRCYLPTHVLLSFFLTWYFFFTLFAYFMPADRSPFTMNTYTKTEHDIVEQLKGLLPESQKLDKNVYVDKNFLKMLDKSTDSSAVKQLKHEFVMEFTSEARVAYELVWFEPLVNNEEAVMHLFPSFYLSDYYSYACMPSPMALEYPYAVGFDEEDAEYSLNWVAAEAHTVPDRGFNVDLAAEADSENPFDEDNVWDFPVEPLTWEFDEELDEDIIDVEEFAGLHYNMYSFYDYLLHEYIWDKYREETIVQSREYAEKLSSLQFYVSLPYQMSQLFDDPDYNLNDENHEFEAVRIFNRDVRFAHRIVWLNSATYSSEATGEVDLASLRRLEQKFKKNDTSLDIMHHNNNTYYMEKRPYDFNHFKWLAKDKYVSVDYESFVRGYFTPNEALTEKEMKEFRMDGVILDDERHDGMTSVFEDDDYADENAFVDMILDEHFDGETNYDEASVYGALHPLEFDDDEDFQVRYGPASVSEWAREELRVLKYLNDIDKKYFSLVNTLISRHQDEAEVLDYKKIKLSKMRSLAADLVPLNSNPDIKRFTDFEDTEFTTTYAKNNYDLIDSLADKMYTSEEVFDIDSEHDDASWSDIYEAFLGYVPDMLDKENFIVARQRTSSYGKTDSYILFGIDLETDLYNAGSAAYLFLVAVLSVFLFKIFHVLHWKYLGTLLVLVEAGLRRPKKWRKYVKRWKYSHDIRGVTPVRFARRSVVFESYYAPTKKIVIGINYSTYLLTLIALTGIAIVLIDTLIRFSTFRWDLAESKNYVESGGQTNIYRYKKINKRLKNSKIYLFKPEENANFAFSSFYKNAKFFRKFTSEVYPKIRSGPPKMYVVDSESVARSSPSIVAQSLNVLEKDPVIGYLADLPPPEDSLINRYKDDPFYQLELFTQYYKPYEVEFATLNTYMRAAADDYDPLDEFGEDFEDHWRINNKVLSAGGDSVEASRLYLDTQFFINWVALSWNVTDMLIWQRIAGQGRYFSNYAFVGNKQNQVYDNAYDVWILTTGFNDERNNLAGIRYLTENRKRLGHADLRRTTIPNMLRHLVKRKLFKHYLLSKRSYKIKKLKSKKVASRGKIKKKYV